MNEITKDIMKCLQGLPADSTTVMRRYDISSGYVLPTLEKGIGILTIESMLESKYKLKDTEYKVYSLDEEDDANIYIELPLIKEKITIPFKEMCIKQTEHLLM